MTILFYDSQTIMMDATPAVIIHLALDGHPLNVSDAHLVWSASYYCLVSCNNKLYQVI